MMEMRNISSKVAVLSFFALAGLSVSCGSGPFHAAGRALAGAVGMFFVMRIAAKIFTSVMIDAIVEDQADKSSGAARDDA